MITCRRLVELLLEYVEKALPADESEAVRGHLAVCPQCVAYEDSYRRVIRLARQLPPGPVPGELLQKLREAAG